MHAVLDLVLDVGCVTFQQGTQANVVQWCHFVSSVQAFAESRICSPPAKLGSSVRACILIKSLHESCRLSILVNAVQQYLTQRPTCRRHRPSLAEHRLPM